MGRKLHRRVRSEHRVWEDKDGRSVRTVCDTSLTQAIRMAFCLQRDSIERDGYAHLFVQKRERQPASSLSDIYNYKFPRHTVLV